LISFLTGLTNICKMNIWSTWR